MRPAHPVYTGAIVDVDYQTLTMRVNVPLPDSGVLAGQQMHIFNDDHHCCFEIRSVTQQGQESIIHFAGDPLLLHSELQQVDEKKRVVQTQMQAPYAEIPNRRKGWTLANEAGDKVWKSAHHEIEWAGDDRAKPGLYQVDGLVAASDFTDADGDGRACVRMYDFGKGDRFEIPTSVFLRRGSDGGFTVHADTDVELVVAGVTSRLTTADFARGGVKVKP
jgi:hypothetical protein